MKMVLLAFALLATACSQSTTTPTVPPATTNPCAYTTNSNEYIELKINTDTLREEGLTLNGDAVGNLVSDFLTMTFGRSFHFGVLNTLCVLTSARINKLQMHLYVDKTSNYQNPLGNYVGNYDGSFVYFKGIYKYYKIPKDSLTLTITNCTADLVSGTFVGHAFETSTNILYPFNGSFNNLKRNGF